MMSNPTEQEQSECDERSARSDGKGSNTTKDGDLEKLETTKEGEILTQNAEAARREWIKTARASPRNWPTWKKCESFCSCAIDVFASDISA